MENPAKEISGVIHLLTQSPPPQQQHTIDTYFMPNASFTHPLCRTGSWDNSRFVIRAIYRWYKIMSPTIELTIHSIAYDEPNLLLYVSLSQVFRIWFIPFYCAPVNLVTVIKLQQIKGDFRYYISGQNDLYQTDQWVKFIPFLPGSSLLVLAGQYTAAIFCVVLSMLFGSISKIDQFARERIWQMDKPRGIEYNSTEPDSAKQLPN